MTENPRRSLLLVEDETLILLELEDSLTAEGFDVVTASSGAKAITAIDKDAGRFSGLVTDIRLGKGPDGWELARRIREEVPRMPVVYMSGDSAQDWAARGVPDSIMLHKPFVNAQLMTAIASLLNRSDKP